MSNKIAVRLKGFNINAFKGIANFHVFGGENFELNLHTIGPMTMKEAIQWCSDHGYEAVVK